MKTTIANIVMVAAASFGCYAAASDVNVLPGVTVNELQLNHSGNFITVDMQIGLAGLDVSSNKAVLITPLIVNQADTLRLPAIGVYGRQRYYYYSRNFGDRMLSGANEMSYRSSDRPDLIDYSQVVPFSEWMNGSKLLLSVDEYGCCHKQLAAHSATIGGYEGTWMPQLVYVVPQGRPDKTYSIEGSAFIEFPVNESVIKPDFRSNHAELGKILASIDSLRSDDDVTLSAVWLKGYASPDGKYEANEQLAKDRTESLKKYVNNLYHFPGGTIKTAYEPEDWAVLRKFVEGSNMPNRTEILAAIDSDLAPDAKEWRIKSHWPDEYAYLLQTVYPSLRHTDYKIAYNVRKYTDVNEIKQVLATRPQNLDLNEMYLIAAEYEPGSDEFIEVYENAVRMFPQNAEANLNAANAAIARNNIPAAERYIAKAGNSAEATYARGIIEYRKNNVDKACELFSEAAKAGLAQASEALDHFKK